MAGVLGGREIQSLKNLLGEWGYDVSKPSTLYIDNQSAIAVARDPQHHGRMKHMNLGYHWLRETVAEGSIC